MEARERVMNAAKESSRADRIAFMTGCMMERRINDIYEFMKLAESTIDAGHTFYLISLPRDKTGIDPIHGFATEERTVFH